MKKVLFVCLGNICRSPMGEGALKYLVKKRGISNRYRIDSAGTSAHHVGEKTDQRMRETSLKHGIELTSKSQQVTIDDFDNFDLILAMDKDNYQNLENLAFKHGKSTSNLKLMREFDSIPEDMNVPDPYYGGDVGFENVYQIVLRSCENLLDYLEKKAS